MNTRGSQTPQPNANSKGGRFAFDGITYALDAFKDAPAPLKGVVVILAIVSFASLVVFIGLFQSPGNETLVLASFIAFLFFATIDLFLFNGIAQSQQASQKAGIIATRPTWNRLVLAYPISSDALGALKSELNNLRNEIFAVIADQNSSLGIQPDDLRANIFLPNYTAAGDGYVCWLEMSERLQINMQGDSDERIRFRPGQGATGMVFVEETPHVAAPNVSEQGIYEWDDFYRLSPEQRKLINPQLRWILSTPLNVYDPVRQKTKSVGVLNIDGLNKPIDDRNFLNVLLGQLFTKASNAMTPHLMELPKVRLIVGVEDSD